MAGRGHNIDACGYVQDWSRDNKQVVSIANFREVMEKGYGSKNEKLAKIFQFEDDLDMIQKEVSEAMNVGFSIGGHWISTIPKHYVALCETS